MTVISSLENKVHQTVIIGSGPAGYTAAVYAARADLFPVVVEGDLWGGLLQETTDVENYPGFSPGISGPELMSTMREQAQRFGAQLITNQATAVTLAPKPGMPHRIVIDGSTEILARTVIFATGSQHRKLGLPLENELAGRGVSYCATCDAAFFRGKHTAVIGGGDSAMEEAIFLAKFAATVTIVNRRDVFRASDIMLRRAQDTVNIRWETGQTVDELVTAGSGALDHLVLRDVQTGDKRVLPAQGVFIAIGHTPQSDLVKDQLDLDDAGYVVTTSGSARTGVPGVFAAGDVVDHTYRQAITAAGSGCQAALEVGWYLRDTPIIDHAASIGSLS